MIEEIQNIESVPELRFPEFSGEWVEKKLGDVFEIYDGIHQTPKYVEKGIPFVSVENINDIEHSHKYISKEAFEKDYKIKPQKNDILMTRITAGIIGATAIVKNNAPLGFYVSLALLRRKTEDNFIEFLEQRIKSVYFKQELHKRIIHIAFPKKINLGEIGLCRITHPQLLEQKKIANFLMQVDNRIDKLEEKKEKLEEYKKGVMQNIFSQEIRFKDDNGEDFPDWEKKRLGDIICKNSSNISANSVVDNIGKYKLYGATGLLKFVDFYKENEPYISIVKDGAGVGRILLCDKLSSVLGTLDILKPKGKNNLNYIYYLLLLVQFEKYITGSTIPHIYFRDYSKNIVLVPKEGEQQKIANFLTSIDKQIEKVSSQIESSKIFKNGLLQKMFV